jgi:hypothetical protein
MRIKPAGMQHEDADADKLSNDQFMTIDSVITVAVIGVSRQMLRDPYGSLLASSYLLADFLKHITEQQDTYGFAL